MENNDYENKEEKPKRFKKSSKKADKKVEKVVEVKEIKKEKEVEVPKLTGKVEVIGTGKGKSIPQGRKYTVGAQVAEVLLKKGEVKLA